MREATDADADADADAGSAEAVSDFEGKNNNKSTANNSTDIRPPSTRRTSSIRSDERLAKILKHQGHCVSRSIMAIGGQELMEESAYTSPGNRKRQSAVVSTVGISQLLPQHQEMHQEKDAPDGKQSKVVVSKPPFNFRAHSDSFGADPPKHARKQGHDRSMSVMNLNLNNKSSGHTRNSAEETNPENNDDLFEEDCGPSNVGDKLVEVAIEEAEMYARENAETRPIILFFWNGITSLIVFARYLISLDSVLSVLLSFGLTYSCYNHTKDDEYFDGNMNFVLLGFAVLMPLSMVVRITFFRREKALENIANLQMHAQHIYLCHACWDWGKAPGARSSDPERWLKHSDEVLQTLAVIGDELTRFLTLPNSSFSRHRETIPGRREAAVTIGASYRIFSDVIDCRVTRLAKLLEELKLAGFSASEASRVRQYEKLLTQSAHNLRMLKMYRSPKALNALLNLTTTLLPPFYAPAFAQIAHDSGSLGMGLAFAGITSLALSALYESVQVLEDPFVAFLTLDGIDVYEELAVLYYHQLIQTRREIFPNAHMYDEEVSKEEKDNLSAILDDMNCHDSSTNLRALFAAQKGRRSEKSSRMLSDRRGSLLKKSQRMSAYSLDLPDGLKVSRRRLSINRNIAGQRRRRSSIISVASGVEQRRRRSSIMSAASNALKFDGNG